MNRGTLARVTKLESATIGAAARRYRSAMAAPSGYGLQEARAVAGMVEELFGERLTRENARDLADRLDANGLLEQIQPLIMAYGRSIARFVLGDDTEQALTALWGVVAREQRP